MVCGCVYLMSSLTGYVQVELRKVHIDGLAQSCGNFSALAMELPQFYAKLHMDELQR